MKALKLTPVASRAPFPMENHMLQSSFGEALTRLRALYGVFITLLAATVFVADRPYSDPRCATPARYEAMAAGADCFNPPAFPRQSQKRTAR